MRTTFVALSSALFVAFATTVSAQAVRLTEVRWHGTGCYKIEMPMGTVYFEKDNGVSGFKSFVDPEGRDWIASYLPPGPNGDFRGFPNSVGNFGHAGRDSGSTTIVVDGKTEGDVVILESSNADFTFQYWFFADRVAIKVLRSKGDYCFLLECVAGGSADAEDYFVTADGKRHIPSGEFRDFTPEWFYLGDPKAKHVLFLAKTPDDDAPNENHRQIRPNGLHNMDLYSFGRTGREHGYTIQGMSGNEHVAVIGFAPAATPHEDLARMIEGFLAAPFGPHGGRKPGPASDDKTPIVVEAESLQLAQTRARDLEGASGQVVPFEKEGDRAVGSLELEQGVYDVTLELVSQSEHSDAVRVAVGDTAWRAFTWSYGRLTSSPPFTLTVPEAQRFPLSIEFAEPGILVDRFVARPLLSPSTLARMRAEAARYPEARPATVVIEAEELQLSGAPARPFDGASGLVVVFDAEGARAQGEVVLDLGVYEVSLDVVCHGEASDAIHVEIGGHLARTTSWTYSTLSRSKPFTLTILEKKSHPLTVRFAEPGVMVDRIHIKPLLNPAVIAALKAGEEAPRAVSSGPRP